VLRLQAFKFKLRPNGEQLRNLRQFAGSCRFVYNKALALNVERYDKKEKRLGYAGLYALLPNWKMEQEFLANVPAQALQQALKNLERAYTNFFQKRADVPKFKKKGQRESFRIPQGFEVDNQNGRIKLPKLGWVRYRKSQGILGERATSPSANRVASGTSQFKRSGKSKHRSILRHQQSVWIGA
jgi:putative transposase